MASPKTDNILAHWALENTADSKGTRTLTNYNTVPFNSAKVGNGADFTPGSNHLLDNATEFGTETDGDFSVSYWTKLDGSIADMKVFISSYRASATNGDWVIRIGPSPCKIYLHRKSASNYYWNGTTTLSTGTWYHVVIVYKSSDSSAKLYINGTEETFTRSASGGETWRGGVIAIGNYEQTSGTYCIDGLMDELSVFNDQLTQDEVTWMYNGGNGRSFQDYDAGGMVIVWSSE